MKLHFAHPTIKKTGIKPAFSYVEMGGIEPPCNRSSSSDSTVVESFEV